MTSSPGPGESADRGIPVTARTKVAAVVGAPVRHSLSPAMHNAAFGAAGLDWVFVAFETGDGAGVVAAARTLGLAGLAVTAPHKAAVAASVDEVDPAAAALASVNTVCVRSDGSTFGASTDGAGFVASLRAAGVDPSGARFAVLGAGGAARSIIDALGRGGVGEILVINRTPERGRAAAALAPQARCGTESEIERVDVVVNATSVGMGSSQLPCNASLLGPEHVVVDIVYEPLETALLAAARRAGARVIDGLGMLAHQAALQQELWTGRRADPVTMRLAAEAELARRHR